MSKTLGYCHNCERPQVVNKNYRSPSGDKNCGLCGKNSLLFAFLIIMGLAFAANNTDCDWIGWDSIQICGQFGQNVSFVTYITNVTNYTVYTNYTNITQISNITPGHTNTMEVLSVLALIIIILFVAAQLGEMRILGVFASMLLMVLGLMILTDGIVYKVGDIGIGLDNENKLGSYQNISGNVSLNETYVTHTNQTSTDMYAEMTVPYVSFKEFIGLVLILLSLFGLLYYGLGVSKFLNQGK